MKKEQKKAPRKANGESSISKVDKNGKKVWKGAFISPS